MGIEFRLSNNIKLRLGLKQARGATTSSEDKNDINIKLALGAGAPIKVWKQQYVQIDYALDPGSVGEGLSHLFSFSMELK